MSVQVPGMRDGVVAHESVKDVIDTVVNMVREGIGPQRQVGTPVHEHVQAMLWGLWRDGYTAGAREGVPTAR